MEIEGGSNKGGFKPQKQKNTQSQGRQPQRIKYLDKFKEKKRNQKKKLKKAIQQRKMMNEMTDENQNKDWKVVLREKFEQTTQAQGPNLAFGLSRLFHEENVFILLGEISYLFN